jgi:hypothetical protein
MRVALQLVEVCTPRLADISQRCTIFVQVLFTGCEFRKSFDNVNLQRGRHLTATSLQIYPVVVSGIRTSHYSPSAYVISLSVC